MFNMYTLTNNGIDIVGQVLNTATANTWQKLKELLDQPEFNTLSKYIGFDNFDLILDPTPGRLTYASVLSGKIKHLPFDKETNWIFSTSFRIVFYFKTQIFLSMTPEIFKDIVAKLESLQDKLGFINQKTMLCIYSTSNYFCLKQNLDQYDLFHPASPPAPADSDVCLVVNFNLSVPKKYIQET